MKKNWESIAIFLLILSGIFWGSIGVFEFDIMNYFTDPCWFTRLTYFLMGLSAIYVFFKGNYAKRFKR